MTHSHHEENAKKEESCSPRTETPSIQDEELEALRQLLFAKEIALLKELLKNQREKQVVIEKVSEVLAESIILRSQKDQQLNMALEPVVDDIFKTSLHRRKNDFVNVLFPLIGPVIRKSIAETFLSMLGNFSQSVEVAFSWQGLKWRFEAWRSGKPFSEIVLLHTILYRVEQVFFIHSETGIALAHVANEEVASQDADMVSGMLTAIQDFARDSFVTGDSEEHLNSLQLGDMTLIIEKRASAYLACAVRGTPPVNFRSQMQEALDLMLVEYEEPLANFSGDNAPFLTAVRYLHPLLQAKYTEGKRKISLWAKLFAIIFTIGTISSIGYFWYATHTRNTLLESAVQSLNSHPGIMLTNIVRHRNSPWEVLAFKDELAPEPETLLEKKGIDKELLSLKTVPFISYDTTIIEQRIEKAISMPRSVKKQLYKDGTLVLTGEAQMAWAFNAKEILLSLPGIHAVDISGLHDPLTERVIALVEKINRVSIEFPFAQNTPVAKDATKLQQAIDSLVELDRIAKKAGLMVSLTVFGHADSIGSEKQNYEISMARAKTVAAKLYAQGSSIPVSLYGMGAEFSKEETKDFRDEKVKQEEKGDQASRRIELHVYISRAVSVDNLFDKKQ